jgi:phosphoenolpyruvate synthase/pyruvate phosphate dikinase
MSTNKHATAVTEGHRDEFGAAPSDHYVLAFEEVGPAQVADVGGKGANLGELSRIDGIQVPPGFCVTTAAYRLILAEAPQLRDLLDRLANLDAGDSVATRELSAEIRRHLEATAIPDDVAAPIALAHARLGEDAAYAVRSSATAEDSPAASFAGQHNSFLNIAGRDAVLQYVCRCWASLFTERAVAYRARHGFDHRKVGMAVVVQKMVQPQAAGVLFTADPVTSNRKVVSVDATFGLGEDLVSGRVNPDAYKVRNGEVIARAVRQEEPVLTDEQVVQLAQMGRRLEAHFGHPQDIEWCLADDDVAIVQSRPITTLFPIPVTDDDEPHVYVSVGHQQMMTDALKPLGLSLRQQTSMATMHVAGGRQFVDVARMLTSPASRGRLVMLGKADPLIGSALDTIAERDDFLPPVPDGGGGELLFAGAPAPIETDHAIVDQLIRGNEESVAALERDIETTSGLALLDFLRADFEVLKRVLSDPRSICVIMAAMEATGWLNQHVETWLGEKNAADTLTRSVPGNVTSEMGLALLDVADVIRPRPEVVAFLRNVKDDNFLDRLDALAGGPQARDAIRAFLDRYGMRCVGEIDITRPRWSERPSTLLPMLLGHIDNSEPGAGQGRFEEGRQQALAKERVLLERLRALPDGERKADETKRMIDRVRTFSGYREYPKYGIIRRYFVYKKALMEEAERLVAAGVLREKEDIFFLTVDQLHEVARTNAVDDPLITRAKQAFSAYETLTPPRVFTSEGEVISGTYGRDDVPPGALTGLAVSGGTIEGRARVILDLADADLEPGDILVTSFTDPGWTPVFLAIKGLVTEVGGLMTHGAVIAREYGLPAVVGVEHATGLIRDGQQIRVHGTDGYVEPLA